MKFPLFGTILNFIPNCRF